MPSKHLKDKPDYEIGSSNVYADLERAAASKSQVGPAYDAGFVTRDLVTLAGTSSAQALS